jgi:hypothetical protein
MADEIDSLSKNYNKLTNNIAGGRLSPQRDAIVRETHNNEMVRVSLQHDKPDFISGKKTWNAVVVRELDGNAGPALGTTAEYVYNNIVSATGDKPQNFQHCYALIPDVHDLVTPTPEDISQNADLTKPINFIPLTMASYFYSFNKNIKPFGAGSIIEVQFNDNELNEGIINTVIVPKPSVTTTATQASDSDGSTVGDADTSGDGEQTDNNDVASGKCGDGSTTYPYVDCKSAPLTSTGQVVTLHPVFFDDIDKLLGYIKEYNNVTITIGESIRSQQRQLQIRKNRCPEWNGCVSEQELKTSRWTDVINKCKCSDKTPVAAAEGVYASNHLKGLAVDFKMDVYPCKANSVDSVSYENCMKTSKIVKLLDNGIGIKKLRGKIRNLIGPKGEPWHWSHNGR